jgi:hypothetical protein
MQHTGDRVALVVPEITFELALRLFPGVVRLGVSKQVLLIERPKEVLQVEAGHKVGPIGHLVPDLEVLTALTLGRGRQRTLETGVVL